MRNSRDTQEQVNHAWVRVFCCSDARLGTERPQVCA